MFYNIRIGSNENEWRRANHATRPCDAVPKFLRNITYHIMEAVEMISDAKQ